MAVGVCEMKRGKTAKQTLYFIPQARQKREAGNVPGSSFANKKAADPHTEKPPL
jgi:hypothetical protein